METGDVNGKLGPVIIAIAQPQPLRNSTTQELILHASLF